MASCKVLVFDINGVFFFQEKKEGLEEVRVHRRFRSPIVNVLREFFQQHPCKIVIWSTMTRKNMQIFVNSIEEGLQTTINAIFSQEDCDEGPKYKGCTCLTYKKDLKKVAEKMNVPIDDCLLIDDVPEKRVGTQNFYKYEYTPNSFETLVQHIKNFLNGQNADAM